MTTDIYLIRHGEAYSNVESVIGGIKFDRGLTERGQAQVRALAARLASGELKADALYASTLPRARMTAEPVAEALGLPIIWDDDLHELRPGDADGLAFTELRERYPQVSRFIVEPYAPLAPGGESWATFQHRTAAALDRIVRAHQGQRVVVVAHGGVIEVAFLHLLGLGPEARSRLAFHMQNTAITHWRRAETPGGRWEWRLVAHNDHSHLAGMDS